MEETALQTHNLWKEYPGVVALRDVSLTVEQGEVHALVGENGAGKSTLIKTITGAVAPEAGKIYINGKPLTRFTPAAAADLGLAVIHQERQIAGDLSVAENVLLGRIPMRPLGIVNWPALYRQTEMLLERVGLNVDPRLPAVQLNVAEQQALEVARALSRNAQLVVMDEPTASLSAREIAKLFSIIKSIKSDGRSVIYVSHHLDEIFEVADRVTVMRDGSIVAANRTTDLDSKSLMAAMFGRDLRQLEARTEVSEKSRGPELLEVRGLEVGQRLNGISTRFSAGELTCIVGGIGSGRRELALCLAGALHADRGVVRFLDNGRAIRSPRSALQQGLGFIPSDRKREGLLLELDVVENIGLSKLALDRAPVVSPRKRRKDAVKSAEQFRVRYREANQRVRNLSGGNQQKVLMARLLSAGARVLVLDEPTAGVDVVTKVEIYEILRNLVDQGSCVIAFTSDYEEVRLLADRVIALNRGRIAGELSRSEITSERLLALEIGEEEHGHRG